MRMPSSHNMRLSHHVKISQRAIVISPTTTSDARYPEIPARLARLRRFLCKEPVPENASQGLVRGP